MGKLSHSLLDLGFFCALGTSEHPGHCQEERYVRRGPPLSYDQNNGVIAIYDEDGRPWIKSIRDIADEVDEVQDAIWDLHTQFGTKPGVYVPHSNDGGHFVRTVLPTL